MSVGRWEEEVRRILTEQVNVVVDSPDADLIESGQMDSLALVEFLFHLEAGLGIVVDLEELDLDDLRTLRRIAAFVAQRKSSE